METFCGGPCGKGAQIICVIYLSRVKTLNVRIYAGGGDLLLVTELAYLQLYRASFNYSQSLPPKEFRRCTVGISGTLSNRWGQYRRKLFLISIKYQNKSLFFHFATVVHEGPWRAWEKFPIIGYTPISIRSCRSRKPDHPTFENGIAAEKGSPKPCFA
jgi:hypothetical protein